MAIDTQLGFKEETTYGTPVTVTKFSPLISEAVKTNVLKLESAARRSGTQFQRSDASLPTYINSKGDIVLPCNNRGLGIFLKHMLGAIATSGPADTAAYTHTATVATLQALGLSVQTNRSFYGTGAAQPFTWAGVKITGWALELNVQGEMTLTLTVNADSETTATGLATASYPTDLELLSWAAPNSGLTIAGVAIPATAWKLSGSNSLLEDSSRYGNPQVEPIANAFRDIDFAFTGDFKDLSFYNLFNSASNAGQYPGGAGMVFKVEAPSIITGCATTKPSLTMTTPLPRIDDCTIPNADMSPNMQQVSGKIRAGASGSPITAVYVTGDSTP